MVRGWCLLFSAGSKRDCPSDGCRAFSDTPNPRCSLCGTITPVPEISIRRDYSGHPRIDQSGSANDPIRPGLAAGGAGGLRAGQECGEVFLA